MYHQIMQYGKFYYPATLHYPNTLTTNVDTLVNNVVCDRCKQPNLQACIGYQNSDLCMLCVHQMLTPTPIYCPTKHWCTTNEQNKK